MNPRKVDELTGSLLAFAQGGRAEIRLVHVTPPIRIVHHVSFAEAKWEPAVMPLAYECAPILVDNQGGSAAPALIEMIDNARRSTPVGRFASKFRSRSKPLPVDVGRQVVAAYRSRRLSGATVARHYAEALPYPPPRIDRDREGTYAMLISS